MKKAKVMLMAITIFTVVGGALAFKAKSFGSTVYTTDNTLAVDPTCPFVTPDTTISDTGAQTSVTDIQGNPCELALTAPKG